MGKSGGWSKKGWDGGLAILLLAATMGANAEDARPQQAVPDLRITVRVCNLAKVSSDTLDWAEREAARILGETGVQVVWINCPGTRQEAEWNPVCRHPTSPSDLVLRLVARFNGDSPENSSPATLGFSILPEKPHLGTLAAVSYQRVLAMTANRSVASYLVLGVAMTHEIGHLLLGTRSHPQAGLMRAVWDSADLHRAALKCLSFSGTEAEALRAGVVARAELARKSEPPSDGLLASP
jgi:hypothetical protein